MQRGIPAGPTHLPVRCLGSGLLAGAILVVAPGALAQTIDLYFPPGTAGYDQQLGVTVLSRLRPLYEPPGVRLGGFVLDAALDAGLFANSNVNGTPGSGSWGTRTTGSVSAASDWTRNGIGASVGFDNYTFFSLPGENYVDWNVGLTGRYSLADDGDLFAAYSHSAYHQLATSLGTVRTTAPIANQTDTALLGYSIVLSNLTLAPDLSASAYRFGTAVIGGTPVSQRFLDRNAVSLGLTARYATNDTDGLVIAIRGTDQQYISQLAGQPSNDSESVKLVGGFDQQASGVWRYRMLVGIEVRAYAAYPTRAAPSVEGSAIWTPNGLTTVTGTVSTTIEDPQTAGSSGYELTSANVVIDHEYERNILLQLRGGVQYAQYQQGGSQTSFNVGAGATWLINRNMRLSLDYGFTKQSAGSQAAVSSSANTQTTGAYTQSVATITLHFAL